MTPGERCFHDETDGTGRSGQTAGLVLVEKKGWFEGRFGGISRSGFIKVSRRASKHLLLTLIQTTLSLNNF